MTITCSNCGCPFVPGHNRTVVACDFCGQRTFNPYFGDADEDNGWDELDEWEDDHPEIACIDCGAPGIDCCQCCGGYLCGRHSETGCGFCSKCPTQEWIDDQEEDASCFPPIATPQEGN